MIHQQAHIRDKAEAKVYGTATSPLELPKYRIPRGASDSRATLELLRDELFLDGNAKQNLATFCQTYEDAEIRELMDLCIDKNMIDKDEYPQTAEIEGRCIHMLANLWNGPEGANTLGTSTVGSSEACMLGGIAALKRWQKSSPSTCPVKSPSGAGREWMLLPSSSIHPSSETVCTRFDRV